MKIKILSLSLFLSLFFIAPSNAQHYGINLKDKNFNYEKVNKLHQRSLEGMNNPILKLPEERMWKRIGDTLEIKFYVLNYLMINRYVFETKDKTILPESRVIFQQESISCGACAEKSVRFYKSSAKSGFRLLGGNEYLSGYDKKTKLIMIEEEGKETCLTLIFIPVNLEKKEYKKLYQSLPKSR